MEKRIIFLSLILLVAVCSSVWGSDSYFLNSLGAKWSVPANWTAVPHDVNIVLIGSPPTSPSGAWATLDSAEPNVLILTIGDSSGSGRLDIADGARLNILQAWRTAIGSGSVATVNVSGGIVIDGAALLPGPNYRGGSSPISQWAVDGTMNYTQTGGFVYTRQTHLAVNAGSALNIKITGGTLNMGGTNAQDQDPNFIPNPVLGQLNIDIDGDGYVLLRVVDTTTTPSHTHITLNGNGKLAVLGNNYSTDPSLGGRVTSRGTLVGKYGSYSWPTGHLWKETLIYTTCTNLLSGDMNSDCRVDMKDFALFAGKWLSNE